MKKNVKNEKNVNVNAIDAVDAISIVSKVDAIAADCAKMRITAGKILSVEVDVDTGTARITASPVELTPAQRRRIRVAFAYGDYVKSFGQIGQGDNPGHAFHYEVTEGITRDVDLERRLIGQLSQIRTSGKECAGEIRFVTPQVPQGFVQRFLVSGHSPKTLTGVDSVSYSVKFRVFIGRRVNAHGRGTAIVASRRKTQLSDPATFYDIMSWRTVLSTQSGETVEAIGRINEGDKGHEAAAFPIVFGRNGTLYDQTAVMVPKGSSGFTVRTYGEPRVTTRIAIGIGQDVAAPGTFFSHLPGTRETVVDIRPIRHMEIQPQL